MDCNDRSLDVLAPVDRVINLLDVGGQLSSQLTHSRGGRRRNHNLQIRQPGFQGANQLRADIHLTHADGMDPKHVPIRNRLLDFGAEPPEPLLQSIAPAAAPKHLQEIVRRA